MEANLDALRVLATLDTHHIKTRLGTDRDHRTLDAPYHKRSGNTSTETTISERLQEPPVLGVLSWLCGSGWLRG